MAAAVSGYDVVLYDVDQDALRQVPERLQEMAAMLVGGGYCSQEEIPGALARVSVVDDLARATANADLVSESVFERLDVKREIHRRLDEVCPPRTILTTNSSVLQVSEIEDVVARGDRFAALHSHLGAPLVDIVPGPRTDPEILDCLRRFVLSISGEPLVLKKEYPGYILNAMLGPVIGAALALLVTGKANHEEVDRSWMRERHAPVGPFGMMDLFGLNIILDNWQYGERNEWQEALKPKVLALLQPYAERGELGVKAGKGFYVYPEPAYQQPGFLDGASAEDIHRALLVALVVGALCVAAEEVAEPADIERAWIVGTYLDAGPFTLLAQTGESDFLAALDFEERAGRLAPEKARVAKAYLQRQAQGVSRE
jgi:3-hydroxybutyryl-CoA dehydrogenase